MSTPPTPAPRRALLVFLDGVGIGADDPRANPFAAARLPRLRGLLGGRLPLAPELREGHVTGERAVLVAADATLGVPGTPQSGTGQTALLTGRNAAELYGRHFGPWVPTALRELLAAESLLGRARGAGRAVAFANAYPVRAVEPTERPRIFRRPAAPPLAAAAAGALSRDLPELLAGEAVASSITNEHWRKLAGELPEVTPEEAGRRLARIAAGAEVTLFAHYDTDHVGHRGGLEAAVRALEKVDAFLGAVADALPPDALLVVASDHGNVEDVAGGHTRNPVPVLAAGPGREAVAARVRSITDVAPAILELLDIR